MWQDKVMLAVSLCFVYSLIPTILLNYKIKTINIPYQTLVISAFGLYIFGYIMFTLSCYLTGCVDIFNGILWNIMIIQKMRYK